MILKDIRRLYGDMFDAEKKVADYILANPATVVRMSMADLARQSGTSDATVLRMCRHIGQSGFYQLKINLAMELNSDAEAQGASGRSGDGPRDLVDFVDEAAKNITSIPKSLSTEQVEEAVSALVAAERVYTFGWGSTYAVAFDLAHRLMRSGKPTHTSENVEHLMRLLLLARPGEVLVTISHSGDSTYTVECMRVAHDAGMRVILITNAADSEASQHADIVLATNARDDILGNWGHTSHVAEMVVCDLLLFRLREELANTDAGNASERVMAQFKL